MSDNRQKLKKEIEAIQRLLDRAASRLEHLADYNLIFFEGDRYGIESAAYRTLCRVTNAVGEASVSLDELKETEA